MQDPLGKQRSRHLAQRIAATGQTVQTDRGASLSTVSVVRALPILYHRDCNGALHGRVRSFGCASIVDRVSSRLQWTTSAERGPWAHLRVPCSQCGSCVWALNLLYYFVGSTGLVNKYLHTMFEQRESVQFVSPVMLQSAPAGIWREHLQSCLLFQLLVRLKLRSDSRLTISHSLCRLNAFRTVV